MSESAGTANMTPKTPTAPIQNDKHLGRVMRKVAGRRYHRSCNCPAKRNHYSKSTISDKFYGRDLALNEICDEGQRQYCDAEAFSHILNIAAAWLKATHPRCWPTASASDTGLTLSGSANHP